jgi:hypothetical protein
LTGDMTLDKKKKILNIKVRMHKATAEIMTCKLEKIKIEEATVD